MALPTLVTPEFTIKLPSTGEEILFRPFLVKEEKILFIALESNDEKDTLRAVKDILTSCVITNIDVNTLTSFDVEYLFLNIRGKSVSEEIILHVPHSKESECDVKRKITLNINDIKIEGEIQRKPIIMLNDTMGIKMRYIMLKDMLLPAASEDDNKLDIVLNSVINCVEYVFDNDEIYDDFTKEEMKEFIGNLSTKQFEEVSDFFNNTPILKKDISFTCKKCGVEENITIEGLSSFFT